MLARAIVVPLPHLFIVLNLLNQYVLSQRPVACADHAIFRETKLLKPGNNRICVQSFAIMTGARERQLYPLLRSARRRVGRAARRDQPDGRHEQPLREGGGTLPAGHRPADMHVARARRGRGPRQPTSFRNASEVKHGADALSRGDARSVSYTHLTLPTKA